MPGSGPPPSRYARHLPASGEDRVLGIILAVIIGIILIGLVFKLLKLAIIVALIVGGVMLAQKYLGNNDRPRIK